MTDLLLDLLTRSSQTAVAVLFQVRVRLCLTELDVRIGASAHLKVVTFQEAGQSHARTRMHMDAF